MTEASAVRPHPTPRDGDFLFGPFHVDIAAEMLWKDGAAWSPRRKSWQVLLYLVRRPRVLVTKQELQRAIWKDAAVVDDTLTQSIGELRRLLGDSARHPRFIETVHRRGFRFIAEVSEWRDGSAVERSGGHGSPESNCFVGRRDELARLQESLRAASAGNRQLVFVTGETGAGKTTLVHEFLRYCDTAGPLVVFGQCVQALGPLEPYMPLVEGLERALQHPSAQRLVPLLEHLAPSWYQQIPALHRSGRGSEPLAAAPPRQRMLREIEAFLEAAAVQQPIVIVLEDLHWSDLSTAGLLSYLAGRRDRAALLLVGTYRPGEVSAAGHPIRSVKQNLLARQSCSEVALPRLSVDDVREYLERRFGDELSSLAPMIHQRSGGNPLFVGALVDDLQRREWLVESEGGWTTGDHDDASLVAVPRDLGEMILAQLESLESDEREILDAASVAGLAFDPRVVAAALEYDAESVEECCRHLVQRQVLAWTAEGDGARRTRARIRFAHPLHRQVIYDEIGEARRRRLHRSIGGALEAMGSDDPAVLAAELSVHFERADDDRAVRYLEKCAERAQARAAHKEALSYLDHAIDLLARSPACADRDRLELSLRLLANTSLNVIRGYASPDLMENSERGHALCRGEQDAHHLFEVAHVRWYARLAGENVGLDSTLADIEQIADDLGTPEARLRARLARGRSCFWRGRFAEACEVLVPAVEEIERQAITFPTTAYGIDPAVGARMQLALAKWFVGLPSRARRHARAGLARAEASGLSFDLASALSQSALLELHCGDAAAAAELAARSELICEANDIAFILPLSRVLHGAARVRTGDIRAGLAQIRESLGLQRQLNGSFFCDVILALAADAHGRLEEWEEGIRCADEGIAVTQTNLERIYAAELWRVKGWLTARSKSPDAAAATRQAAAHIQCALETAREQGALSLELRAAMSMLAISEDGLGRALASAKLERALSAFSEGLDTADLCEARSLLAS